MGSNAKAVIVDSSIWVAYFDKDDAHYQKAKNIIDAASSAALVLTDYVVQEVVTIFLYRNQQSLIDELLNTLKQPNIDTVSVEGYFLERIIRLIRQQSYKPKISLTDWSLLFLADEFNFNLLTFDKQLANANKRLARQAA